MLDIINYKLRFFFDLNLLKLLIFIYVSSYINLKIEKFKYKKYN